MSLALAGDRHRRGQRRVASTTALFTTARGGLPAARRRRTAKAVVDGPSRRAPRDANHYNDPDDVLGRPTPAGFGPDNFFGFLSLGERGPRHRGHGGLRGRTRRGFDLRVCQAVSSEPVTVYAAGRRDGPFVLHRPGDALRRDPGDDHFSATATSTSPTAEIDEARYFRIEDGEQLPLRAGRHAPARAPTSTPSRSSTAGP